MTGDRRRDEVRIAIVGGGFGGIGSAVKLKMAGFTNIRIYEKEEGAGGTWRVNTYPGCEVDIPSHSYSFSFMGWDWTRTHARQPELVAYTEAILDRFDLRPHFTFGTAVDLVEWRDDTATYLVHTSDGASAEYDIVVTAVGFLSVPKYPDWPGLDSFQGPVFHTARWDHSVDLRGKRVAVVGTGSTAAQVVPEVAKIAEHVYVFQREPGWINAKNDRDFSSFERRLYHLPIAAKAHRLKIFYDYYKRFGSFNAASRAQAKTRAKSVDFIRATIPDEQLAAKVTPNYPWGCKRPVLSDSFYPALMRANVTLVAAPVVRATSNGVVDATGAEHEVDVLVMSTGFRTTDYLDTVEVVGRGGVKLHDYWGDRPRAYLGVTVPRFPNLFLIYGPNTNGGGSILAQQERQAEVMVWALKKLVQRGATSVDTSAEALDRWIRWVDQKLATDASAMEAGCTNYYHSGSGANATQWPGTHLRYFVMTKLWRSRGITFSLPAGRR
ncbi:flavin-containing monooxygenase [Rhizomonospora bruguierae]|uniref:flavin-containing monooxygenase n=1 Tax=Rhizomonospora bruguierae TaxID=1581705 RepID=UPI001BCB48F3|nr:NAD(P)/FAD-dependent oxidoreductase [Micromonospora sp. NBRC 107566]